MKDRCGTGLWGKTDFTNLEMVWQTATKNITPQIHLGLRQVRKRNETALYNTLGSDSI